MDEIGAGALKPNPRLQGLSPFIGVWRTEGSHPLMPGQALQGRTSFAWHQGGAFVIMHSEMQQPEVPPGVAVIGSDDDGRIMMIYFDARGVSRHYEVSLEGGGMRWKRDDPKISQRMTLTLGEDGRSVRQVGEISEGGGPWQDDLALTYHLIASEAGPPD